MKKRVFSSLLLTLVLGVLFVSCGGDKSKSGTYELALITDVGTINDKSFNQGSWQGLEKYAKEKKIAHKYYQPAEKTTHAYIESIDLAVAAGAKVIVTPGFLFEPAIYKTQETYPEVKFVLIDGIPHPQDDYANIKVTDNTYSVFYAEEQAGFLAGYSAVKDGYTKLGFMGGMAVPAVVKFGYGFLQGAEYAGKEMGIDNIEVMYNYTGGFSATPEVQSRAASWYKGGTEVIFACGGAVGNSVMAAAEASDGKVIGVDVDQSDESKTVITSSLKMLEKSVYDAIDAYYNGSFPGGKSVHLNAADGGVGLPMKTSKFKTFSQSDYDAIYEKLSKGEISLMGNVDSDNVEVTLYNIPLSIVKIVEIK